MEVLLTGGNSKFGAELAKQMEQKGWNVEIVPRLHLDEAIQVSKKHYDLIFFNHNKPVVDWNFDKYPSELLKQVTADKVGWMITYAALTPKEQGDWDIGFWQYVAQKGVYINQMKFYSKRFATFVCDPGGLNENNYLRKATELAEFTLSGYESGSILRLK